MFSDMQQQTPQACLVDVTPPTFSGITSLVAQNNGAGLASWGSASDVTLPIDFLIYVQEGTNVGLFSSSNIALITRNSSAKIFLDRLGALLKYQTTYHVGVRARDGVGNVDSNTASFSFVSSGVSPDDCYALLAELKNLVLAGL